MSFELRCDPRSFPINHAGGGAAPEALYTLSGVSFLVSGTFLKPTDILSPEPDNVPGETRQQAWAGGGSSIGGTGAAGGGAYSENPTSPIAATEAITVAPAPAAGASGTSSSVGVLCVALGGQSPTGPQPGQGGQAAGGTGVIKFSGGNGDQGSGTRQGGGGAGSEAAGGTPAGGIPNGGYAHIPGALSGWPGGGGGATASGQLGRPGFVRITFQVPSLPNAPRIIQISEFRDTADALSRSVLAPTLREVGDLLVLIVSSDAAPTIEANAWDDGALAQVSNGVILSGRTFYRTATGDASDDATVTTSSSQKIAAEMYCLRGAGGPPEWTTATGTSNVVQPPAHTNSFGYRASLAILAIGLDSNSGVAVTLLPVRFEGFLVTTAQDDTGVVVGSCWQQYNNTGITSTPYNVNVSTNFWVGTIVVPGT